LDFQRSQRVGEAIQKEISDLLLRGLKDPRIGFVTITTVDVSSDLSLARVYFTVMGDDEVRKNTEKGLKSAIPFLRRELGKRLRLRIVPDLTFSFDSSLEYGRRIESIIQQIHETPKADDSGYSDEN
jgi:ribosome-binding factor A